MTANLRERRRALRLSLKALPYLDYLKAMLVLLQDLRRLNAERQDPIMSELVNEVIEQLRCAVTPSCEPAPGEPAGLYARFHAESQAKVGSVDMGQVVFWQTLEALLVELAEQTGHYEAANTISGAFYYHFADLGTATFGLANPNINLGDDDPMVLELDRFGEAIERVAAGAEPDEVYTAIFG